MVSTYLDIAEINALDMHPMTMKDWINELDAFLKMTRKDILNGSGKITHEQALKKAHEEYDKYMKTHLTTAEQDFLDVLNKKIEEKFIINYEDLLKDFLSNIKDNNKYDFTLKLRNKFTPDEIYKIETLLPEERDKYLKELLTDEEYKVYEIFVISNKFNMVDFIDYLNRLIELNNPTVTVLVPNKNINYDYIDSKIKTKVSDNIYRGIKIIYKNKVYDFSLNEGNV